MKLIQMIEMVKQHHPHIGDTELRMLFNRASDDLCAKTELIKESWSLSSDTSATVANQRYYALPTDLLKITEVYINNVRVPRLIGKPKIDDPSEDDE